jgi:cytochrome c1
VESVAFQTIQIGSATVEKKVSGDICVNCHGAPPITFPGHNARHVVVWDTDQCNACHDYSGNHAAALSNRVHAVHSANTLGDMLNTRSMQTTSGGFNASTIDVDWSDIGYPQNINNCATCHASGNTSYRSVVHEVSCLGCHGDNIYTGGSSNHMLQNGGDWPTP